MDFARTDEQVEFGRVVRRFFEAASPEAVVREIDSDHAARVRHHQIEERAFLGAAAGQSNDNHVCESENAERA